MDSQKDNTIKAEEENAVVIPKKTNIRALFEDDEPFAFTYRKTEKLASAVYLVTNLFSENEPMKWNLRKKVSDLLSFIIEYKNISPTKHDDFVYAIKTRVLDVVSLLSVSSHSGLVSSMNFSILEQEFNNLISNLDSSRLIHGNTLSKSFFNDHVSQSRPQRESLNNVQKEYRASDTSSDTVSDINKRDNIPMPDASVFKRTNRQNIIIGLLKKKKDLSIKDISLVIKGCSEKTIQRELISLISLGLIKRSGERRWSKYSLINGQ